MSMSLRENITAVIETCFSETKEEIQEVAINNILELIRNDKANCKTEPIPIMECKTCAYHKTSKQDWPCVDCLGGDRYEPKDEPQTTSTPYKVDASSICKIEPHTNCPKTCPSIDICTKDDTDCIWKKG